MSADARRAARAIAAAAVLVVVAAWAGCSPPEDAVRPVSSTDAPLFTDAKCSSRVDVLHAGDLLQVVRADAGRASWKGPLDDATASRSGQVVEVRRASGEPAGYVFASDLGPATSAPTAGWICRRLRADAKCPGRLRRMATAHGVLGYDACLVGACKVGLSRGRTVAPFEVEGIRDGRMATLDGVEVALLRTAWSKAINYSGSELEVLRLGDPREPIRRALQIPLAELDGRQPPAIERKGRLTVEKDRLVFTGERRALAPRSNAIIFHEPIKEIYRLAK